MALAMPVMSIRMPSRTNRGIDSSSRCDMPSSMRLTITLSGARVASATYPTVAMPKAKAIGTPAATATPTPRTKKMSRL